MSEKSQTPNALAMTVARKILGALVRNAVRGDGVLTDVSLAKEIETLIAGEVSRVREKADKYLAALDACMPDVPGEPCPTCDVLWDCQAPIHEPDCILCKALREER